MTDSPPSAQDATTLMRAGLTHHAANRLAEAEAAYRAVLERRPDHADALGMLAVILADGPDVAVAEAALLRHLALRPDNAGSLLALGRLRAGQGDEAAAVTIFRRAAAARPDLAPIHNELGVSLHKLERREEALTALDEAVARDAAFQVARGNRGLLLFDMTRFGEATDDLLAAMADPDPASPGPLGADVGAGLLSTLSKAAAKAGRLAEAEGAVRARLAAGHADAATVEQLAKILDLAKRPDEATEIRNDLARRAGVQRRGPNRDRRDTLVVLGSVGSGHTPTRYLVDPQTFTTLSVTLLSPDQADAPLGPIDIGPLAEAGAIFSTLGDAHRDLGQLAQATAFCEALGKPVINPPAGIPRTGRDRATALFEGISGLVTPSVRPISPADIPALRIDAPVLIRPAGDHGGENLIRLASEVDKDAYLATGPEERLLVTPFHGFRSPDGYWRKYRLIFVDRRVYPFHLAIGEDWLLHYWRAEMARSDWKLAEEERFLENWRAVFGPQAAAAVDEIARRLDLDYGGIDCALTADGGLLLFEANACILLHLDEPAASFPAKHRHVPPIRDAFTRLVRDRAA